MKIIGLDNSLSSPGVVKAELDDNLDIINMDYLTFTTVKKYSGGNISNSKHTVTSSIFSVSAS